MIGRNGIGKSTLLRIFIEKESIDGGEMKKADNLKIGYISQELFWESFDNTLGQEIHTSDPVLCEYMSAYLEDIDSSDHELVEKIQLIDGFKCWELQTELLKYF